MSPGNSEVISGYWGQTGAIGGRSGAISPGKRDIRTASFFLKILGGLIQIRISSKNCKFSLSLSPNMITYRGKQLNNG